MILAYRILTNVLYPFLFALIYLRVFLKKEDSKRYKEKIQEKYFNVSKMDNHSLIWFHAASVGELKSIIPIIKNLNKKYSNFQILITTTTLSSGKLAVDEFVNFNNISHRYMPLDISFLIERFLDLWKPKRIFLVDSEIWPNLILKAKIKNIPIGLINARLTKKTLKKWMLFPKTAKKIFETFDFFLCANKETKIFLEKLNAKNIKYVGNIKFINNIDLKKLKHNNKKILSESKFWIAVSIHKEEDFFCLQTHIELKKNFNNIITVLAPRHIDRVNKIRILSESLNLKTQILNLNEDIQSDKEIIIINSFGVLQNYFQYANSVFVGKSTIERLKHDSGQSPIDAAFLNCKIYHGPYVSNFKEIYEILESKNISKKIQNYHELSKYLINDFKYIKKINNGSNFIQLLGEKIFLKSTKLIENFIND